MVYASVEDNPFTPSFGEVPLVMAGRSQLVAEFDRAFSSRTRRPSLTSLVSGARGTGKTALLTLIEERAQERGWIAVDLVSLPGMLEDALEQGRMRARHLLDQKGSARITSLGVGPLSVGVTRHEGERVNWRSGMTALLDELAESEMGLLITIDEITPDLDELIQLVSTYQLFVRENRRVALIMAGLPHNTSLLLRDRSVSFLRRAQQVRLGRIADFEMEKALRDTFAHSNRRVSEEVLPEAVSLIEGLPFMMQLVGFRMWEEGVGAGQIDDERAREGMCLAKEEMKSRVLLASYQELSPMDRRFLHAMAEDSVDSAVPDIARRLDRSNSYATQYKNRLIEQGVIGVGGNGRIHFELPLMREFLSEQEE